LTLAVAVCGNGTTAVHPAQQLTSKEVVHLIGVVRHDDLRHYRKAVLRILNRTHKMLLVVDKGSPTSA